MRVVFGSAELYRVVVRCVLTCRSASTHSVATRPVTAFVCSMSGWTSGKLSGNDCGDAKAVEASWIFVVVFLLSMSVYFVGGVVVKKQQGRSVPGDWLPNHQFWASLYGLVIDGVGLVARGGKPAGYAEISAAVDAMAKEKATSGTAEQEVEDPTPAKRQATRSAPTSLHSAATVGDIKKLERLLKANGCPQIDAGDSRRYTAFHVACAAGHLDCKGRANTRQNNRAIHFLPFTSCMHSDVSVPMQALGCCGMPGVTRSSQTMWVLRRGKRPTAATVRIYGAVKGAALAVSLGLSMQGAGGAAQAHGDHRAQVRAGHAV